MTKELLGILAFSICCVAHAQAIPNNLNAVQTTTQNAYIYNNNAVMNPNSAASIKPNPTKSAPTITSNDVEITTSIQSLITQSKDLAGANIRVLCRQGIVTLEGNADSFAKASEAASIAKSVNGVKNVISKITVKPNPLRKQ